jgi:hypothetical protein
MSMGLDLKAEKECPNCCTDYKKDGTCLCPPPRSALSEVARMLRGPGMKTATETMLEAEADCYAEKHLRRREALETKDTNPKDAIGVTKLPLHLVPDTMIAHAAVAFLEGALKYGKFNWRVAGVRLSIYLDALERHLASFRNGEDSDPDTNVEHLENALACIGIILDARACGKLTDDRPPRAPVGSFIRAQVTRVKFLQEKFKDHHPHQYTLLD